MKKPNPYHLPGAPGLTCHLSTPKVTMGHGALSQLGALPGGRIALVLDAYLMDSPLLQTLTSQTLAGQQYRIICGVKDEPFFAAIDP